MRTEDRIPSIAPEPRPGFMNGLSRLLFLGTLAVASASAQSPLSQGPREAVGNTLLAPVGIEQMIAAARAADDERTAATMAADRARLDAIFSDELRYAHSNGKVDDKAAYIGSLISHRVVYESFDYKERRFQVAGPGIVLMSGRVIIQVGNDSRKVGLDLNFLAVWREEAGRWRCLAWQSCANPPARVK